MSIRCSGLGSEPAQQEYRIGGTAAGPVAPRADPVPVSTKRPQLSLQLGSSILCIFMHALKGALGEYTPGLHFPLIKLAETRSDGPDG